MQDVTVINDRNDRAIKAAYTRSDEHPHAVVTYDGLHVVNVTPATSKTWADETAAAITKAGSASVHAEVI